MFRYSQVSWQHLGEKAIQIIMESLVKAKIEGQGLGQESGVQDWVWAPLETRISIRKGAEARSLKWAGRDSCIRVGTWGHRPHPTGHQATDGVGRTEKNSGSGSLVWSRGLV